MDHLSTGLTGLLFGMVGTGIGGILGLLVNRNSKKLLGSILEFSAGLMMAVVCFQLIPVAFEQGGVVISLAGILSGIALIVIIDAILRKIDFNSKLSFVKAGRKKAGGNLVRDTGLLRAGILMAAGIALHNLPEGFAVGAGFEASPALGFTLAIVIAVHDVPEGIAMSAPMRAGGFSATTAFTLTLLSGLPMGIGALLGSILGGFSQSMIACCLGFAGGAMLYIISGELIPEAKSLYKGRISSVANIAGIIIGAIVSLIK